MVEEAGGEFGPAGGSEGGSEGGGGVGITVRTIMVANVSRISVGKAP